jgi:hypothetical protein
MLSRACWCCGCGCAPCAGSSLTGVMVSWRWRNVVSLGALLVCRHLRSSDFERIFRPLIESAEVQPGAEGAILESPSTRVPNPIFGCRRLRWFVRKIGRIENETRVKSLESPSAPTSTGTLYGTGGSGAPGAALAVALSCSRPRTPTHPRTHAPTHVGASARVCVVHRGMGAGTEPVRGKEALAAETLQVRTMNA